MASESEDGAHVVPVPSTGARPAAPPDALRRLDPHTALLCTARSHRRACGSSRGGSTAGSQVAGRHRSRGGAHRYAIAHAPLRPTDPQWASDRAAVRRVARGGKAAAKRAGFWVVTRHADCQALLRDRRASSDSTQVDITKVPPPVCADPWPTTMARWPRPRWTTAPSCSGTLLTTHAAGLVAKAFTPKMIDGLRARTEAIVAELLDAALERASSTSWPNWPTPAGADHLRDAGVPVADHERFQGWSAALARGLDPEFLLTEEVIAARMEAITSFGLYCSSSSPSGEPILATTS